MRLINEGGVEEDLVEEGLDDKVAGVFRFRGEWGEGYPDCCKVKLSILWRCQSCMGRCPPNYHLARSSLFHMAVEEGHFAIASKPFETHLKQRLCDAFPNHVIAPNSGHAWIFFERHPD